MFKKNLGKVAITSMVACASLGTAHHVLADDTFQIEKNNIFAQDNSIVKNVNPDVRAKEDLKDLAYAYSYNLYKIHEISLDDSIPLNKGWSSPRSYYAFPVVKLNGDMGISEGDAMAAHTASLTNSTGHNQTLSTASFTYTQEDSVTTVSYNSSGMGMSATAEIKIPFIAGISTTVAATFDYTKGEEARRTTTKSWTVPPQTIDIPAGKTYKVEWMMKTGVAKGTANLTTRVTADIPYQVNNGTVSTTDLKTAMTRQQALVNQLTYPTLWDYQWQWEVSGDSVFRQWGTSTYTVKYGTDLVMKVYDVTKRNAEPVLIDSIPMDITPTPI
ncbi:ETX/MTX2 family pore-forming toxin [Streptococcaceae bacterium ESL0687]|nr:ETX/MTX2 family pore-forming toxin [Streptococcaceae bacterium ESL0687]